MVAVIDVFDRGWDLSPGALAFVSSTEAWTFDRAGRASCRIAHTLLAAREFRGHQGRRPVAQRATGLALRAGDLARG